MKKNISGYLVMIILVLGTAIGTGVSIGEQGCQEDTNVTVGVNYVAPLIFIESPETCEGIDPKEDVEIKVKVFSPSQESTVEDVEIEMKYEGEEDEHGNLDIEDSASLSEGELEIYWEDNGPWGTVYEADGDPDDGVTFEPETMWRFGYWEITATVEGTDGESNSDMIWTVAEWYCEIVSADDGSAGGKPGQTLEGDDFENEEGETPEIMITSNAMWNLTFDDSYVLEGPEGSNNIEGENTKGGYEGETKDLTEQAPVYEESFDIHYWVNIPLGQNPGSYSTDAHPAVHTLSSIEGPVYCPPVDQEETAYGGDTEGSGPAWWYYFDTDGDDTQTIWAGQYHEAGEVTVTEEDYEVTFEIDLADGWELQAGDETVKIQGYEEDEIPDFRPPGGDLETHRGEDVTEPITVEDLPVESYRYYVIHLDLIHTDG